jgi:hypothetical protein
VNDFMTPDRIVVGCSVPDMIRLMEPRLPTKRDVPC